MPSLAMVRLPIALFFSASRSKNRSSLALSTLRSAATEDGSRVWAWPAVNNASVSRVANNILILIKSDVPEQRRKQDHDYRRPRTVDRQVIRLPFFERDERSAPSQEANVKQ